MKKTIIFIFSLINSIFCLSQDNINFYYGETILEINHMKFELKMPMAYRQKFKSTLFVTNLTDSFKIITPSDIKIITNDKEVTANGKYLFIVPPKCTRKFKLIGEESNFKSNQIKTTITNIKTTGKIVTVYQPKGFILDKSSFRLIEDDNFPTSGVGPLQLKLKRFDYKSDGTIIAKVSVSYTGEKFLGIYAKKIRLIDSNGKIYINQNQESGALFYRKEKKQMMLTLVFENPYGKSKDYRSDNIQFEEVFVEYQTDISPEINEFILIKNGEGKGDPKDEKEKDIEVIED
jgi:hypothetical protein